MKSLLFITTSFAALLAGGSAFAGGSLGFAANHGMNMAGACTKTLYNQNSGNNGVAILSDNYTSGNFTSNATQAADDFVVPSGKHWSICEVDVTGVYLNGSGPSNYVNVYFYRNKKSLPGHLVRSYTKLSCSDNAGSFACSLPKSVRLKTGHYWVSVVANIDFQRGAGEWGWGERTTTNYYPAVWRSGGSGWTSLNADLMFDLKG